MSSVDEFINKLKSALALIGALGEEKPHREDDWNQQTLLRTRKISCIEALRDCYKDSDELSKILSDVWTPDVAKEIADMRTAFHKLTGTMLTATADGFNHPIPIKSDAPQEQKNDWIKYENVLLRMINRLSALRVGCLDGDTGTKLLKHAKAGEEKWRRTGKRMFELWRLGKLPGSLRQTAKLLKSEKIDYNLVRTAAHNSAVLKTHFRLKDKDGSAQVDGAALLDELAREADHRTRQVISQITPQIRKDTEATLRMMPPQDALTLALTLLRDPDTGSTGDVSLIEDADQDSRDTDWSD